MPLVAHNNLPAFSSLHDQGHQVLSLDRATHQDIRELHIGFLNMMPDAALTATEKQFIRLIGNCNQIAQFYVYPFSLKELQRGKQALAHIEQYYFDIEELKESGLDALIITGANVSNPNLQDEAFWKPLIEIVSWAEANVSSILCSCLATHALLKHHHNIDRQPMGRKQWGIYEHTVADKTHPLMLDVNTRFDAPHSRFNDIRRSKLKEGKLKILVDSPDAGVHLAVSPDGFRTVYFQGHPEYDAVSLLKEYKRDYLRFIAGDADEAPPFPENYFSAEAKALIRRYSTEVLKALGKNTTPPDFPENELIPLIDNTWSDTAKSIVNNWLGLVYRTTNLERTKQYMPGVDPADPLGILKS